MNEQALLLAAPPMGSCAPRQVGHRPRAMTVPHRRVEGSGQYCQRPHLMCARRCGVGASDPLRCGLTGVDQRPRIGRAAPLTTGISVRPTLSKMARAFLVAGFIETFPAVVVKPTTSNCGDDNAISSAMASSTPGSVSINTGSGVVAWDDSMESARFQEH